MRSVVAQINAIALKEVADAVISRSETQLAKYRLSEHL
jgi:hypothetical protein